jgi:hypothetical protein
VDTGRSQGWELRVVVERGGPLEGRSARHLLAAGPLRFPFWMAYGICQGYEGTLASRMSLLFCRLLCLQLWPLPLTSSRMQLFRVVPNTSPQPARRREEQNSKPAPASMAELGTPSLYEYCHQSTQQNGVTTDPQPLAGSRMARPFFAIGTLHGNNNNTDRARP